MALYKLRCSSKSSAARERPQQHEKARLFRYAEQTKYRFQRAAQQLRQAGGFQQAYRWKDCQQGGQNAPRAPVVIALYTAAPRRNAARDAAAISNGASICPSALMPLPR